MSIKVMSHVWEHSRHKGGDLLLLLAIADHADDHGRAFPSIGRLARKTRMTERNVQFVLRRLTHSKELTIRPGEGPHGCHLFQLFVPDACPCHGGDEKISPEKSSGVKKVRGEKSGKILPKISPKPSLDPSLDLKPKEREGGTPLPPTASPRAARCPADYHPAETIRTWAQTKHPQVDFDDALEAMRDCEFATAHSDWDATLRNWIRREARFLKASAPGPPRLSRDEAQALANARSNQQLEDLVNGRDTYGSVWTAHRHAGAGVPTPYGGGRQSRLLIGP